MIPQIPVLLPMPFAQNGERHEIPDNNTVAGSPDASWNLGFPPVTGINKQAGGKPPTRLDFQGILHTLSQHIFYLQSGGVYPWVGASDDFPGLNYMQGSRVIGSNGQVYASIKASGPDITGPNGFIGPVDPVTDTDKYWVPVIPNAPSWNREVWIKESGVFTAPVTGWYEILAIDGGYGGWVHYKNHSVWGGCSGAYKEAVAFFEKGQTVPITVGAGGPGQISANGEYTWPLTHGGITSVGDIDFSLYAENRFMGQILYCSTEHWALAVGAGFGGQVKDYDGDTFYGAGGWAQIFLSSQPASTALVGNGQDGAVRFRFYDPALANGPVTNTNNEGE